MEFVTLGKTKLMVCRSGLSASCLELVSDTGAFSILEEAYKAGINFYEVLASSTQACKKMGETFSGKRKDVVISVTSDFPSEKKFSMQLDSVLENLCMDYIDIFNIKSDEKVYLPNSIDEVYDSIDAERKNGRIHFIGFYTHDLVLAKQACESGFYDVIQFPLNLQSSKEDLELISLCEQNDIGLIARMPFAGGKIDDVPLAFGYLKQFENVVPVYNASNFDEIQKLIYFESNPPVTDQKFIDDVEKLRNSF